MIFNWAPVDSWSTQVPFFKDPHSLTKLCFPELWGFSKNLTFQRHWLLQDSTNCKLWT